MEPLIDGDAEASFGLIIRDRHNHDNYAFIDFEHLEKLIEKYHLVKEFLCKTLESGNSKKKGSRKNVF